MSVYTYTKNTVNIDALSFEIKSSAIITALSRIDVFGTDLSIYFVSDLPTNDRTALDGIVERHTGAATVQTEFVEVSAITTTSVNSSVYAVLNGMSSPPLEAGTYMVMFSGSFGSNAPLLTTPGIRISVFNNGVQIKASEVIQDSTQSGLFGNSPIGMSTSCSVTVLEGQRVDIRWKNNGSGNTITSYNRILNLMRVK